MPRISYFSNAEGTTIGDHANFQTADAITNNYQVNHGDDRVVVCGRTIRRIIDGDINYQRILSSEVLSVSVGTEEQGSMSNTAAVRVKKTVQTAEIFQCQGTFTTTTLGPVDENDQDKFKIIARRFLEAAMCRRSALLTQLFAVVDSDPLTLISYNELANGDEFTDRYWRKNMVVYYYLEYTRALAIQSLRDEAAAVPVTNRLRDWSFNLETLGWHYDPASISLSPPSEEDLRPFYTPFTLLRQGTLLQLDVNKIIACVEETLSDFLFLITQFEGRWLSDLSYWARQGLLTFGAVVDGHRPGILAHHPSTPSPEWYCHSYKHNIKARFSTLVPWRVDLLFSKVGEIQVELELGMRIPQKDRHQLRAAYLCQSLSFIDACEDVENVVYMDLVGFQLKGTFHDDPTTRPQPAFLFCAPMPVVYINGMPCIEYPLPESLFYWSFDQTGKSQIPESDWKRFNIPKLELRELIGSCWDRDDYNGVQDVLSSRNYNLDGRQYARDHGHPQLIPGDPHDANRFEELEESEPVESPHLHPLHTQSSTSSFIEVVPEALPIVPPEAISFAVGWARGFLNKYYNGAA